MLHPLHPAARTASVVRLLRAAAPAMRRRGGRLPRQQQPDALRLEYFKALGRLVVAPIRAIFDRDAKQAVLHLLARRQDAARADIAQEREQARQLVDHAMRRAVAAIDGRELKDVAAQFGKRTEDFARQQLDRQIRHAIGVPLAAIEKPTVDRVPLFASANVELIKTVPDRYFDSLQKAVEQAFDEGWSVNRLSDEIEYRGDVAESDARRIARDQVGKLTAQVNQDRQEALGVTAFVWRGALDQRERESHRALEGQRFEWDDPPTDEDTGEEITPGSAIQCRCYAEPVLDDIVSGSDDDE